MLLIFPRLSSKRNKRKFRKIGCGQPALKSRQTGAARWPQKGVFTLFEKRPLKLQQIQRYSAGKCIKMEATCFTLQNHKALTAQARHWWLHLTHLERVRTFYCHFIGKKYKIDLGEEDIYLMYVHSKAQAN